MNLITILVILLSAYTLRKLLYGAFDFLSNYGDSKSDNIIFSILAGIIILWVISFVCVFWGISTLFAKMGIVTGAPTDIQLIVVGILVTIIWYILSRFITQMVVKCCFKSGLIKKLDTKVKRSISLRYGPTK
ncbi:hypothetical protein [Methanococcus sp. CF]